MPTAWPPGFRPVDLEPFYNNVAFTTSTATSAGQLNVWRNSAPAEQAPNAEVVEVDGIPFRFPRAGLGGPDNIRCEGQLVPVPLGRYDWLYLLGTSERRVEDEVAVHFSDGTADFEPLRVSDFWAAPSAFGENAAVRTSTMNYPRHTQPGVSATIWCQRVPIVRRAEVSAVRWPRNVAVHIFATTMCAGRFSC